jgi:hypothetical protein
MTGSVKQSRGHEEGLDCFVAALLAMTADVVAGVRRDDAEVCH